MQRESIGMEARAKSTDVHDNPSYIILRIHFI